MKALVLTLLLFMVGCVHPPIQRESVSRLGPESFKTNSIEREARVQFAQAEKYFSAHQYDLAKPLYQNIRTRYPRGRAFLLSTYRLGSIAYYKEDFPLAAQEFQLILERAPRSDLTFDSVYNLAAAEYQLSQYDRAYQTLGRLRLSEVQAQGPRRAELVFHLTAQVAEAMGNELAVINSLTMIVQLPIEEDKRYALLGTIESHLKRINDAPTLEKLFKDLSEPNVRARIQERLLALTAKPPAESPETPAMPPVASSSSGEKFRLGVLLPLSGRSAPYGNKALDGILLASRLFQATESRQIELVIQDTAGSPALAEEGVEELANEHHVMAVLGPLNWKESNAAAEKAQQLGIPNLSLSAKEGISEKGNFLFQNAITPRVQLENLVKYCIKDKGYRRFAILAPGDSYGKDMTNQFWDLVEAQGGQIVGYEMYPPEEKDYQSYIQDLAGLNPRHRKMESAKLAEFIQAQKTKTGRESKARLPSIIDFDAIFIPDSPKNVAQIAASLAYFDVSGVPLLGTVEWNTDQLYKRGGRYVEGALFPGALNASTRLSRQRDFMRYFFDAYGTTPDLLATQAYEGMELLLAALGKNSSSSRSDLASTLGGLRDFDSPLGQLSFDDTRIAKRSLPVYSLTIGGAVLEQ